MSDKTHILTEQNRIRDMTTEELRASILGSVPEEPNLASMCAVVVGVNHSARRLACRTPTEQRIRRAVRRMLRTGLLHETLIGDLQKPAIKTKG